MAAVDSNITRTIVSSAVIVLAYGISLWRIFRRNRGDRFIESASITVMIFVVTMAAVKIHSPDWVLQFLEVLLYALTFVSVFFGLQQGYRALRRHKAH
ncbi:MAG TPA: hypothetical protein VFI45_11020 [Candidatus Acidoferrum sp.]|nr:hypothetical protein [Candidatus Acidoferrum sp.]